MLPGLRQLMMPGDLSAVPPARYERVRMQADVRLGDEGWLYPLIAAILAVVLWLGAGFGLAYLSHSIALARRPLPPQTQTIVTNATGAVVGVGPPPAPAPALNWRRVLWVNVLFALVVGYVFAAIVRERVYIRGMRQILNRAACPFCEFSLVGLTPSHGAVRCPECGQVVVLHQHRIQEHDLISASAPRKPAPAAGALGAYTGEVPTGRAREIRRGYGGMRSGGNSAPTNSFGDGEILG